jgi:hypothetical protein
MRIEEALATKLRGTTAIADLAGNRIYPTKAPQNTKTAHIIYDLLGGADVTGHDGWEQLRTGRISYTCLAPTYGAAKAVAEAVRLALTGFRGVLSGLTVSIPQAYEDADLYDDLLGLYLVVVDFEMHWRG